MINLSTTLWNLTAGVWQRRFSSKRSTPSEENVSSTTYVPEHVSIRSVFQLQQLHRCWIAVLRILIPRRRRLPELHQNPMVMRGERARWRGVQNLILIEAWTPARQSWRDSKQMQKGITNGQVFSMDDCKRVSCLDNVPELWIGSMMHLYAAIAGLVLGSTLIVIIGCINKRMKIESGELKDKYQR